MIRVEAIGVTLESIPGARSRPRVIAARRFGNPDDCWDSADAFIGAALEALPPLAVGSGQQGHFLLTAEVTWSDGESCALEIPLAPVSSAEERFTWSEHNLARQVRGFLLQLRDQGQAEAGHCCTLSPAALLNFVREREIGG